MTRLTGKTALRGDCGRPPNSGPLPLKAAILAMFLCALFGSNVVAVKITLEGLGAFTTAGIRFGMAAVVIFAWARTTGRPLSVPRANIPGLLVVCAVFAVQLSLFYVGIDRTDASRAALLVNLQPFVVLFLAHWFVAGDRITTRKFTGILIGFLGIAIVFMGKTPADADWRSGDLIILAATVLWAVNAVYTKILLTRFEPFQIVMYSTMFSTPLFFLGALVWDRPMIAYTDARILGTLLYQGLLTSFGFVAWCALFKKYGAVAVNSFVFIIPVSAVTLSGLILGEPITPKILVALALVVAGILVVHIQPERKVAGFPKEGNVAELGKKRS